MNLLSELQTTSGPKSFGSAHLSRRDMDKRRGLQCEMTMLLDLECRGQKMAITLISPVTRFLLVRYSLRYLRLWSITWPNSIKLRCTFCGRINSAVNTRGQSPSTIQYV